MIKEQSFEWLLEGCHRIADQGYTARTAHLTPVQIGILLSYWGMPDHVKDMTVKNPYLLVSKKYAK